jgi:hypothetical protein
MLLTTIITQFSKLMKKVCHEITLPCGYFMLYMFIVLRVETHNIRNIHTNILTLLFQGLYPGYIIFFVQSALMIAGSRGMNIE